MKWKWVLPFVFLCVAIYVFHYTGQFDILPLRPQCTHTWAQADRASIARNYAEESMNFFKPRVHEVKEHEGITGLEFPLINYAAALLYKIFGFHEYLYRGLMLLIVAMGLFHGLYIYRQYLQYGVLAIILLLAWYFSPVLGYYSANFLPDMASLMLSLAGWFYFLRGQDKGYKKNLVPAFVLFALGALVKITSLINPLSITGVLFLDYLLSKIRRDHKPILQFKKQIIIGVGITLLSVVAWYVYARWLSTIEHATYFTMEIHPLGSLQEFKDAWKYIIDIWIGEYYPLWFYSVWILSSMYMLFRIRRANRLLLFITVFLYIGVTGFAFLMLHQIVNHDYYTVPLYILPFFHLLLFFDTLQKERFSVPKAVVWLILFLLLPSLAHKVRGVIHYRYHSWHVDAKLERYHDMEAYLRSLGLQKEDKMVSIYDYSPNITLYLMNQKGWAINTEHPEEKIELALTNSRYAVINDSAALQRPVIKSHLDTLIGAHRGLMVFKLKRGNKE